MPPRYGSAALRIQHWVQSLPFRQQSWALANSWAERDLLSRSLDESYKPNKVTDAHCDACGALASTPWRYEAAEADTPFTRRESLLQVCTSPPTVAYPLLPTPYSLLPTPYSLLPATFSLLPTPYSLLPTPYSLLPTSYSLPPTSYSLPPTSLLLTSYFLLCCTLTDAYISAHHQKAHEMAQPGVHPEGTYYC